MALTRGSGFAMELTSMPSAFSRITINVYIFSYITTEGRELLQLGALCESQWWLGGFVDGVEIVELGFTEIRFDALTTMSEDKLGAK